MNINDLLKQAKEEQSDVNTSLNLKQQLSAAQEKVKQEGGIGSNIMSNEKEIMQNIKPN